MFFFFFYFELIQINRDMAGLSSLRFVFSSIQKRNDLAAFLLLIPLKMLLALASRTILIFEYCWTFWGTFFNFTRLVEIVFLLGNVLRASFIYDRIDFGNDGLLVGLLTRRKLDERNSVFGLFVAESSSSRVSFEHV